MLPDAAQAFLSDEEADLPDVDAYIAAARAALTTEPCVYWKRCGILDTFPTYMLDFGDTEPEIYDLEHRYYEIVMICRIACWMKRGVPPNTIALARACEVWHATRTVVEFNHRLYALVSAMIQLDHLYLPANIIVGAQDMVTQLPSTGHSVMLLREMAARVLDEAGIPRSPLYNKWGDLNTAYCGLRTRHQYHI